MDSTNFFYFMAHFSGHFLKFDCIYASHLYCIYPAAVRSEKVTKLRKICRPCVQRSRSSCNIFGQWQLHQATGFVRVEKMYTAHQQNACVTVCNKQEDVRVQLLCLKTPSLKKLSLD